MFIRAKYVLQFSRGDDLQNTGFDPAIENLRIVWTCIFETGGGRVEGSISYNNRFHIATRFKSYLQMTDVIFLYACSEIRRISEQNVFPT